MSKGKRSRRGFGALRKPQCHFGPVEVVPGLFCGAEDDFLNGMESGLRFDTLVPLNSLDGSIWRTGFRGEILYYPITDYSVLPDDVLENVTTKIIARINTGKRVGIFCMGGHGRTGYIASVILGKLGYDDPIGFLRRKYCKHAVESMQQVEHIAASLHKPELAEIYAIEEKALRLYEWDDYFMQLPLSAMTDDDEEELNCGACIYYHGETCSLLDVSVSRSQPVCWDFEEEMYNSGGLC